MKNKVRPIDANALMEFCRNSKSRTIDCNDIARFPTLDVQPIVHAHWMINPDGYYPQCSHCLQEPQDRQMGPRCLKCGAVMDEKVK